MSNKNTKKSRSFNWSDYTRGFTPFGNRYSSNGKASSTKKTTNNSKSTSSNKKRNSPFKRKQNISKQQYKDRRGIIERGYNNMMNKFDEWFHDGVRYEQDPISGRDIRITTNPETGEETRVTQSRRKIPGEDILNATTNSSWFNALNSVARRKLHDAGILNEDTAEYLEQVKDETDLPEHQKQALIKMLSDQSNRYANKKDGEYFSLDYNKAYDGYADKDGGGLIDAVSKIQGIGRDGIEYTMGQFNARRVPGGISISDVYDFNEGQGNYNGDQGWYPKLRRFMGKHGMTNKHPDNEKQQYDIFISDQELENYRASQENRKPNVMQNGPANNYRKGGQKIQRGGRGNKKQALPQEHRLPIEEIRRRGYNLQSPEESQRIMDAAFGNLRPGGDNFERSIQEKLRQLSPQPQRPSYEEMMALEEMMNRRERYY